MHRPGGYLFHVRPSPLKYHTYMSLSRCLFTLLKSLIYNLHNFGEVNNKSVDHPAALRGVAQYSTPQSGLTFCSLWLNSRTTPTTLLDQHHEKGKQTGGFAVMTTEHTRTHRMIIFIYHNLRRDTFVTSF